MEVKMQLQLLSSLEQDFKSAEKHEHSGLLVMANITWTTDIFPKQVI